MNEEHSNLFSSLWFYFSVRMGRKTPSQLEVNLESVEEYSVEEAGGVQAKLNRNG